MMRSESAGLAQVIWTKTMWATHPTPVSLPRYSMPAPMLLVWAELEHRQYVSQTLECSLECFHCPLDRFIQLKNALRIILRRDYIAMNYCVALLLAHDPL